MQFYWNSSFKIYNILYVAYVAKRVEISRKQCIYNSTKTGPLYTRHIFSCRLTFLQKKKRKKRRGKDAYFVNRLPEITLRFLQWSLFALPRQFSMGPEILPHRHFLIYHSRHFQSRCLCPSFDIASCSVCTRNGPAVCRLQSVACAMHMKPIGVFLVSRRRHIYETRIDGKLYLLLP